MIDQSLLCAFRCVQRLPDRTKSPANSGAASRLNFNARGCPFQVRNELNWLVPLLLRKRYPSQRPNTEPRRTGNEPSHLRRSEPDAEALRNETRAQAAAGAFLVSRAFSSRKPG